MTDPIAYRPVSTSSSPSAARTPADSSVVDDAASQFASLLGAGDESRPATADRKEPSDKDDSARSTESQQGGHEAVERKGSRRDDRDGQKEQEQSGEEQHATFSPGDAILQGLTKSTGAAQVEPAQPTFDGVVQQIVDRILVTDPALSGGLHEVRILLKDSVLPGTEIRLLQQEGRLQIQFVTDSEQSLDMLTKNQSGLQSLLNERLFRSDVVVEVAMDKPAHEEHGDGRSRQRRSLQDEIEQNERGPS